MYLTSDSECCIMTVKDLRELIKNLPDETPIICEDGNYVPATVERGELRTHIAVGQGSRMTRTFITEAEIVGEESEDYARSYPGREFFELKYPVLCLDVAGAFAVRDDKNEKPA